MRRDTTFRVAIGVVSLFLSLTKKKSQNHHAKDAAEKYHDCPSSLSIHNQEGPGRWHLLSTGSYIACALSLDLACGGFALKIDNGILVGAAQVPSENKDDRPLGEISLIILHGISLPEGNFGGPHIKDLFCNALDCEAHPDFVDLNGLRVSSHLVIRRDGEVEQFVSFLDRAWHAGESFYNGRADCNDFSIGIELEGTDYIPYTDSQYEALAHIYMLLRQSYSIENIVGHSDVAPERKTDPGHSFLWSRFLAMI